MTIDDRLDPCEYSDDDCSQAGDEIYPGGKTTESVGFSDLVCADRASQQQQEADTDAEPPPPTRRDPACGMYQGTKGMKVKAKHLLALKTTKTYKAVIGELIGDVSDAQDVGDMIDENTKQRSRRKNLEYRQHQLEAFCKEVCKSPDGTVWVEYFHGRDATLGSRKFSPNGLQTLGSRARNYLCKDEYLDADLKNCFPSLAYYCARKIIGERCPYLQRFVEHRDEFMLECDMTKTGMIAVMFSDKTPKLSVVQKNNTALKGYIEEMQKLRETLYEVRQLDTFEGEQCKGKELWGKLGNRDPNHKNPRGAFFFRQLEQAEQRVMDKIIATIPDGTVRVPMHDGFLYDPTQGLIDFDKVNEVLSKDFHPCIHFCDKPIKPIDLPSVDPNVMDEIPLQMEVVDAVRELQDGWGRGFFFFRNGDICVKVNGNFGETVFQKIAFSSARQQASRFQIWNEEAGRNGAMTSVWDHFFKMERPFYNRVVWKPYHRGMPDPALGNTDFQTGEVVKDLNSYTFPYYEWMEFEGTDDEKESVKDSLDFVLNDLWANTCGAHSEDQYDSDEDYRAAREQLAYFVTLLAWKLQNPDKQQVVIPMLINTQGTGKDLSMHVFRKLLGPWLHNQCQNLQEVCDQGKFNEKLKSCALLICNEASSVNGMKWNAALKELVDRRYHVINEKYEPKVVQDNTMMMVMMSNQLPLVEPGTRRNRVIQGGRKLKDQTDDLELYRYSQEIFDKTKEYFNPFDTNVRPHTESKFVSNNIVCLSELIVEWALDFAKEVDEDGNLVFSPDKEREPNGMLNVRDWPPSKAHQSCATYCLSPMVKFCVALHDAMKSDNHMQFVSDLHKGRKEDEDHLRIIRKQANRQMRIKKSDNVVLIKQQQLGTIVETWAKQNGFAGEDAKRTWNFRKCDNQLKEVGITGKEYYNIGSQNHHIPTDDCSDFDFPLYSGSRKDTRNRYAMLHLSKIVQELKNLRFVFDEDETEYDGDLTQGLSSNRTLEEQLEFAMQQVEKIKNDIVINKKRKRIQEDLDRDQSSSVDTSNDAAMAKALAEGFELDDE